MALKTTFMNEEDRQRYHQLLDYALDHNEEYVIMQFAKMDLDFQIHRTRYSMHIRKEKEDEKRNRPTTDDN